MPASGLMSAYARSAKRSLRGRLRQVATVILLAAFALLVLQTTAHAGLSGHMNHERLSIAATGQDCQHSEAAGDEAGLISPDRCAAAADGLKTQGDCWDQLCTISVLLPDPLPADPSVGRDFLFRIWSDRLGRTPEGILRPPRSFATA